MHITIKSHSEDGSLALALFVIFCVALAIFMGVKLASAVKKILPPTPVAVTNAPNQIVWRFPAHTTPAWGAEGQTWTVSRSDDLESWTAVVGCRGTAPQVQAFIRQTVMAELEAGATGCGFWRATSP